MRRLGPIGLLAQSAHLIGGAIDADWNLFKADEPVVQITLGPINHVKPMLRQIFGRARMEAVSGTCVIMRGIFGVGCPSDQRSSRQDS